MDGYKEFLQGKHAVVAPSGFEVSADVLNPQLFKFQNALTRWALHLGKAALFAQVGLGKTFMQLEWARCVAEHTGKPTLILSPLGVAAQTVREGTKFGIEVLRAYDGGNVPDYPIIITNYDSRHKFDLSDFGGIVLDESSILKHYSKTFFEMVELTRGMDYKLGCTATPAPNDYVEFGNHAMFLDVMHFKDMLAQWFVGEGDVARRARLKHYAREDYWRWLTSWAVCISRPGDLGDEYDMPGYDLPPLHVHEYRLGLNEAAIERAWAQGRLLPDGSVSATEHMKAKRDSLPERVAQVQAIVEGLPDTEPVLLWCDTDFEADALMAAFPEALEVRGSMTPVQKEQKLEAFSSGGVRMMITKPEIAGFGMNWQHCAHMIFAGVSFSFERTYQAIGRAHRYGQERDVHIHVVYAETEGNVMQALQEKQQAFEVMQTEMRAAIRVHGLFRDGKRKELAETVFDKSEGQNWTFYLGDCVEVMAGLPDGSIDLTVTSIPFSNLYIYSDKAADVGNAADKGVFLAHMAYVIRELLRLTRPGRCCAVHVKDLPLFQNRDGVQGIDPFSDDVSAAFRREGWTFQSRVTVEKDPVIEMQKTNSHGLLYKNWKVKAELLRTGLPDYVLIFQKPPSEGEVPVVHDPLDVTYYGDKPPAGYRYPTLPTRGKGDVNLSLPVWQEYANPNWSDVVVPLVWSDIDQTDVLNYLVAKSDKDERHICPLQLDLIARVIQWKTNPGDVVFDPFGGIASTGYKALEMKRRFVGVELKDEYHALGTKYLRAKEAEMRQPTLFDLLPEGEG